MIAKYGGKGVVAGTAEVLENILGLQWLKTPPFVVDFTARVLTLMQG